MIRPLVLPTTQSVRAAPESEMETDSSHRELPPDSQQRDREETEDDTAMPGLFVASDKKQPKQPSHPTPQVVPILEIQQELENSREQSSGVGRPGTIQRYKKAKASAESVRKFGKGSVIDKAG